jgi:hypothetical protein
MVPNARITSAVICSICWILEDSLILGKFNIMGQLLTTPLIARIAGKSIGWFG